MQRDVEYSLCREIVLDKFDPQCDCWSFNRGGLGARSNDEPLVQ